MKEEHNITFNACIFITERNIQQSDGLTNHVASVCLANWLPALRERGII